MFKKFSVLIVLLVLSCTALISCGSDNSSSSESAAPEISASEEPSEETAEENSTEETKEEMEEVTEEISEETTENPENMLPEGVVPITWQPSAEHLIIESDEAMELYTRIKADDYPTVDELKNSEVVAQIDALSAYYKALYGNTAEIDTPERKQLREDIKQQFLAIGSARTESVDEETGKHKYVYDGELSKDFKMELVLGLPASGKSTRVTDPDSEETGSFILDCDVVKELIPEFQESYGGAADAVHFESFDIMNDAMQEFFTGDLKGTNVIIPIVATDLDELTETYIKPFEDAGYTVTAKFVECDENASASRNVARELETGRIINSAVAFSFGQKPLEVYKKLKDMTNTAGEPYGITELTETDNSQEIIEEDAEVLDPAA